MLLRMVYQHSRHKFEANEGFFGETREEKLTNVFNCSVLIPTCNRPQMLRDCLESMQQQSCAPREIIVLDQSDDNRTLLLCDYFEVTYLRVPWKNKSVALNLGVEVSRGKYICVIDDDCIADSNWIKSLAKAFISTQKRVITGRVLAGPLESGAVRSRLHDELDKPTIFKKNLITPIFILSGCNFGFEREIIKEVGRFNENFGPGSKYMSSDDNEWAYRVLKTGHTIYYEPTAIVVHRSWRSADQDREHMRTYGFAAGAFIAKVFSVSKVDGTYHLLKILQWLVCELARSINNPDTRRPFTEYMHGFMQGMQAYDAEEDKWSIE